MRYNWLIFFVTLAGKLYTQQLIFRQHPVAEELYDQREQKLYRFDNDPVFAGTADGFYIYDGHDCRKVDRIDPGSPTVSSIWKNAGTYWIGYDDGAIFQWKQQKLIPWLIEEGWPKSRITGFSQDSRGQFWISTYGEGVYVYSENILYNIGTDDGLLSADIYWLVPAGVRGVLIGTDQGIFLCQFRNGKKDIQKIGIHEELDQSIPLEIRRIDKKGNYLVGTYENGLWEINSITLTGKKVSQLEEKSVIAPGNNHCYTVTSGATRYISEYNLAPKTVPNLLNTGLTDDLDVMDMLIDEEGLLWVSCKNNGLISAPLSFKSYHTGIQQVQTILQVQKKLWTGTDVGLFMVDPDHKNHRKVLPSNILCLLHLAHKNEIWAGTFGDGVFIMDETGRIKANYKNRLLSNDNIFSMVRSGGKIWLATLAGIDIIEEDGRPFRQINRKNGLPTDYIYTLFPDSSGQVWAGTDGEGVLAINKEFKITAFPQKYTVISFTQDASGRIWFTTLDKGIGILEGSSISMMDRSDGLSDLKISGLVTDGQGNIICIHQTGIDIINPMACTVNQTGNHLGIQKWRMKEHSYFMNPEGTLYIPNKDQIIEYRTAGYNRLKPGLTFTSIKLGQMECNPAKTIHTSYDQHDLIVNFSGIWMQHPESAKFRYMLDPVDKTWRYTKDQNVMYADLKPEKYQLTLECSEQPDFRDASRQTFSFVIEPPFWTRWWFVLSLLTLVLGSVAWVTKIRDRRKREIAAIKTNEIRAQLETLKSQINPHFLFNSFNTLISVIETNPEKAVHFVEKLSDFYRHMLQYRDSDFITLREEMEIQRNYQYLLEMRFGAGIVFHNQIFSEDHLKVIPLTLQLLSENAIKHNVVSREKPLHVFIYEEGSWLVFKNEKRPRISVEKSTYFGLKTLSVRYLAITGRDIQIQTDDTSFIVKMPLSRL
jgi:ligand-binding sensor domain-containing protein